MEQRQSPRRPVRLDIQITYPTGESHQVVSRDISDGGIFLILERSSQPLIGELIYLEISGESSGETLPGTEAIVVHQTPEGMGLAFIEIK